jgi:hypothetical protein
LNTVSFHLDGLDLEFVTGDLRDTEAVRRAVSGISQSTRALTTGVETGLLARSRGSAVPL